MISIAVRRRCEPDELIEVARCNGMAIARTLVQILFGCPGECDGYFYAEVVVRDGEHRVWRFDPAKPL